MKLSELIHEPPLQVRLEEALKAHDWDYDIDATDTHRLDKGTDSYREIQMMMGALYSHAPDVARVMWEAYCPYAQPGSLPAILRR